MLYYMLCCVYRQGAGVVLTTVLCVINCKDRIHVVCQPLYCVQVYMYRDMTQVVCRPLYSVYRPVGHG